MKIKNIERFVGGQLEVQNEDEKYLYRGEIKEIYENDDELNVRLAWNARLEGFPDKLTGKWIKEDVLDYNIGYLIYSVSDIGDNRVCLNSYITHELAVLFPRDGSKLDPRKVEGAQ